MTRYYRPLVQTGLAKPNGAFALAGGWGWFTHVECLERGCAPHIVPADDAPDAWFSEMTRARSEIAGLSFSVPQIMGILNVTPDSFSDGGQFGTVDQAVLHAAKMFDAGASIIDIGGESTRPGADFVPVDVEIDRTAPVIAALKANKMPAPISIDSRKSAVADACLTAGATLVNDVSGFTFDTKLAGICTKHAAPVCIMHAQGDPATMQKNPVYDDVLLDVYDFLKSRIKALAEIGIPKHQMIVDPGIGFGKTMAHNLTILQRISLFHGLGVPILLGASRKRFIGTIGKEPQADRRMPGSVAVALAALAQGVQIVRVHDVGETRQAMDVWTACIDGVFASG